MLELEELKREQTSYKQQIEAVSEAMKSLQEQIGVISAEVAKNKVSLINPGDSNGLLVLFGFLVWNCHPHRWGGGAFRICSSPFHQLVLLEDCLRKGRCQVLKPHFLK